MWLFLHHPRAGFYLGVLQPRSAQLLPELQILVLQFFGSSVRKNVLLNLALILSIQLLYSQFKVCTPLSLSLLFESSRAWEEFKFKFKFTMPLPLLL